MIIKRIYSNRDLDERVELVTDNVNHYLLEEEGKFPNTKKSIEMFDSQSESMGEIELDFSTVDGEHSPEYFAPQGHNLYSVYIMNDEGKTIERFVHGFDYSLDSLDTSVFTNSNKKDEE